MLASVCTAAGADAGELRATVRNVKPQQGKLWVALYESAESYKADRRFAGQIVDPAGPEVTVLFSGLAPGRYGLAVFQDLDGDSTLGKSMLGIPTEPYGFSRDAKSGAFGPPGFDALAVTVEGAAPTTTTATLTD
ncbi:DUF2141 domain-containing protein [Azospirillum canadense]|uniref:DUF2141 domain-containing protein n=1 Tax=Azospirillum canadense TaxID=403962 RepID=UPI0022271454|nr:DUF2141 domain-containing protein [Azospirillum canadense]MCW2235782.1 uncharacterized protein (DUF2141 family) [Azospirillum canadense]